MRREALGLENDEGRRRAVRPRSGGRGLTLVELLVVLTLIGVLAAMAAPRFGKAVEQVKADVAVTNLKAIWAAERYYWINSTPHAFTDLATLQAEKLVDGGLNNGAGPYSYSVDSGSGGFTASAVRDGGTSGFKISSDDGQVRTLDGNPVYLPY